MKRLNGSFLRAAFALAVGLLLVLFPEQAGEYLVITVGILFMIPSVISLVGHWARPAEARLRFPIEALGSLLFGLWLVIMPGFFANLLTFVLGFVLLMGGVQQIASLLVSRRLMPVPIGFFIVPVLILVAGLLALFNPLGVRSTAFIIIGVGCLVYAVEELLTWFQFTRRRAKIREQMAAEAAKAAASDDDGIEDAVIISEQ